MKKNQKVTVIDVVAVFKPGICYTENRFEIKELQILAERRELIVLDDDYFPTVNISERKDICRPNIEVPSIGFNLDCKVWGTSITYRLYTQKKKTPAAIRKEIDRARDEKFGSLFAVDLSFIK